MTESQENKLRMYLAVIQVCDEYITVWEGVAAAGKIYDRFKELVTNIQVAARKQETDVTGITKDKEKYRKEMNDQAILLGKLILTYAHANGDNALTKKIDYTPSDFVRAKDTMVKEMASIIHEAGLQHINQLKDFGVTEDMLSNLDQAIHDYSHTIGTTRKAITQRKEATETLKSCMAEADDVLHNQLDNLFFQFKDTEFFHTYKNVRVVIERHKKSSHEEEDTPPPNS